MKCEDVKLVLESQETTAFGARLHLLSLLCEVKIYFSITPPTSVVLISVNLGYCSNDYTLCAHLHEGAKKKFLFDNMLMI